MSGSLGARRCHLVTYMLVENIVIRVVIVAFLKNGLKNEQEEKGLPVF